MNNLIPWTAKGPLWNFNKIALGMDYASNVLRYNDIQKGGSEKKIAITFCYVVEDDMRDDKRSRGSGLEFVDVTENM